MPLLLLLVVEVTGGRSLYHNGEITINLEITIITCKIVLQTKRG